jgi:TIR domain
VTEVTANYGVSRAASAAQSLEQLPAQLRPLADQLGLRLVSLVTTHPERTYRTATGGGVYQHPHPLIEVEYVDGAQERAFVVTQFRAPLPPRCLVFISYSRRNDKFLKELCKYLGTLHETGQVSFWHDQKGIEMGSIWDDEIQSAIDRSSVALLLVTQDFLDSPFIRDKEVPLLLKREATPPFEILWIPVEPTTISLDQPGIFVRQALGDVKNPLGVLPPSRRKGKLAEVCEKFRLRILELSETL